MNTIFKIIALLFGILFLVSAALQYNDPDPLVWMIIWGFAGIISIAFAFNRVFFTVPLVAGILALVGFFYSYPEKFEGFEIGVGDIKNIEEGREAFGLLIIAIVMLTLALRGYLVKKSKV
ncbi:MAG: transmembrane 220 family protein [Maribacter sp.]